jgi:hypothetical protein
MQSKGKYFLIIGAGCLFYPIGDHYTKKYAVYNAYKRDKIIVDGVINGTASKASLCGKILSGEDFNKIYSNDKFIKFTNEEEKHGDVTYTTGRVVDVNVLNPDPLCGNGIHFIEDNPDVIMSRLSILTHIVKAKHMREARIPNDAYVCVGYDGLFKTDKIILGDCERLHERYPDISNDDEYWWLRRFSSYISK